MSKSTKKRAKKVKKQSIPQKKVAKKSNFSLPKFTRYKEAALVITLLALVLRLINLGGLTLWVDEYVHVLGVREFLKGEGPLMPYDGNGLLYNILILPLFAIFGDGAFTGRLPSALAGSFSVFALYILVKTVFNKKIALYAAFLTAISLYLVFWSKIARNYSLFLLTYLFLLWTFYKALNPKADSLKKDSIWDKFQINPKYLGFALISLILAYFSHKLVLFFFFSAVFYFLLMALDTAIANKKVSFTNKYTLLAIPSLIFLIFFFTPSLTSSVKSVIGNLIPENMVAWVLPDWAEIGRLWSEEQYKVYDIYNAIITYDFKELYLLGLGGFVTAFIVDRKAGYFLFSFFIVPLLLMCFVLRGVYNPRYLVFLYPLFLTSIGCLTYFIFHWLPANFINKTYHQQLYNFSLFLPFLLFLGFARTGELSDFVTLKHKDGYVVDKKLSSWSFTNWKGATDYLKKHMKDGDVVMTTLPSATNYYMGWEDGGAIQFRQKYLETTTGEYVDYQPESSNLDAHSIANLTRTMQERDRVWLLADYYFETIYTDPQARAMVFQNMKLHYDATPSGDVAIYSWDRNNPKPFAGQDMVVVVGRNRLKRASGKLNFQITEAYLQKDVLQAKVAVQANSKNEGFFVLNNQFKYYLPANTTNEIQEMTVNVNKSSVKVGSNTLQFGTDYSIEANDSRPGYAVHKFSIY